MSESTKYRNAPLELVIFQISHPVTPPLTPGEQAGLKQALIRDLPLVSHETVNQLSVNVINNGPPSAQLQAEPAVRYKSRDKRTSVMFAPTAITVETTNYDTWEELRNLTRHVLTARMNVAPVDGVERLGLRYIDELRVPGEQVPDWGLWVNPKLVPPILDTAPNLLGVQQHQAVIQYVTGQPGALVTLRYGTLVGPSSVGDIQLARPNVPKPGPFFLIDTDASWSPRPGDEVPPLDPDMVLEWGDTLHGFVKNLFEASLTEKLRTEVLNAQ